MDTAGDLKHVWVRKQIQDLVATSLRPGDALLGERQLEEQFGVSRITVRRAISDLVQDGALVRIKGKGTFVSHGLVRSTLHLASFNEDMRAAGFEPSTRVITALTAVPPEAAAEHLGLAAGQTAAGQRGSSQRGRFVAAAPSAARSALGRPDGISLRGPRSLRAPRAACRTDR
jgi:GntR family transcriptional regulator